MVTLTIKDQIKLHLQKDARMRDNDPLLAATIWYYELKEMGMEDASSYEFLKLFSQSRLTNYESIRRCRAKVQEEHPELRGDTYNLRQIKAESIKKDILNS